MKMNSETARSAADRADVTICVAAVDDLPEVLAVQRAGFGRVAARLGIDPLQMAPMTETLEDLIALHARGITTWIARTGGEAAGTVRATLRDDGVVEIGRLAVADGFTRRGVATALMLALEESFPGVPRLELFTGAEAHEPLALYARLGYSVFRHEEYATWRMVWLAKDRGAATAPDGTPLHWSS